MKNRPVNTEYPEWYQQYVDAVADGDIVEALKNQLKESAELLNEISKEKSSHRYAEGKWSIKELLGHVIDAERILSYRLLRFARKDKTDLSQYDHDEYVINSQNDVDSFEDLKKEFRFVRKSTLMLLSKLNDEAWLLTGCSGGKSFTVRAMAFIIAGHEKHHMKILKEKYLDK
ncbi:MAG: DinB family protein [Bacteroidetes bacterium]|nr:DinB family protein [Bacteroidota bacterium]MBU1679053.1 DinB family protein [Bacteroidota bacterium]MBU2506631.1 DinB family protein [Bacteroidota bacterium]